MEEEEEEEEVEERNGHVEEEDPMDDYEDQDDENDDVDEEEEDDDDEDGEDEDMGNGSNEKVDNVRVGSIPQLIFSASSRVETDLLVIFWCETREEGQYLNLIRFLCVYCYLHGNRICVVAT